MYCSHCGKQVDEKAKFCGSCGKSIEIKNTAPVNQNVPSNTNQNVPNYPNQQEMFTNNPEISEILSIGQPPRKKSIVGRIMGIIAVIAVVTVVIIALSGSSKNKYVDFVKSGHPNLYPNTNYGEAFGAFFSNPKWKYFKSDNGQDVVEFSGGCSYQGAEVTATLQFILDYEDGTFETGAFDMNGVPQIQLVTNAIISKVFEEYGTDMDYDALDSITVEGTEETQATEETIERDIETENSEESVDETHSHLAGFDYEYWKDFYTREKGPYAGISIEIVDESGINFAFGIGSSGYAAMVDLRDCEAEWYGDGRAVAVYNYDGNYQLEICFMDDGTLSLIEVGDSPFDMSLEGTYRKDGETNVYQSQYVFRNSDSELLSSADCNGFTATECKIARNEIYARHGRKFNDEMLQAYFDSCLWYEGSIEPSDFTDNMLNEVELANLKVVSDFEITMGYK